MNAEEIFHDALARPRAERPAFLTRACVGDESLQRRVEALLRAHENPGSFLAEPALPTDTLEAAVSERPGMIIGPYKLLEQIGEGGFGVVFMAEQTSPVRRRIALKILKPGMDTRQVIARFEAERQALALMDHPNIAKVFDGGATPLGRPYFVMELVKGMTITEFCDQQHLTPRQRLELFISVCQAVQHAHQKGIIHRDLKPSNLLVTIQDMTPVVKVIDFGVAKALGQELTDKTLFTGFAQMVGTPLYMSPEQAGQSGLDIDTRSDIYSLGVLLYELLTGTTPFDKRRFKQAGYDEIRRIIREEEPPRPSTRLSESKESLPSISAQRHTEPAKLTKLVRGELDWIVMRALEKDRNRRYETANDFAADVQRYLNDEPVEACPPSTSYRVSKFVRRNKTGLSLMTLLGAALLTAALVTTMSLFSTTAALNRESTANQRLENALYCQTISLVERARLAGHVRLAEQLLDDCNPSRRDWEWLYLRRLRYGSLPAVTHSSHLFSLAISPDGQHFAVGGSDGKVTLRDSQRFEAIRVIEAHTSWARSVAFSPDGHRIVSGGWDRFVRVWDVKTGGMIWEAKANEVVQCVAFHPDGRQIATSGASGHIQFWIARTGAPTAEITNHVNNLFALTFSPDGRLLAGGGSDGRINIWLTDGGGLVHELPAQNEQVLSLAFSPDGRMLAAASGGFYSKEHRGELNLWETSSGRLLHRLGGADFSTFSVAFSPNGRRVAAGGSADPTIKVWDVATGMQAITLRGHTEAIWSLAFSPDGNRLFSASGDRTVRIWDATPLPSHPGTEQRVLSGFEAEVHGIAFHPQSQLLATASPESSLQIWNALTGQLMHSIPVTGTCCVAFSRDEKWMAAGSFGIIRVWEVAGWKLRHEFFTGDVVRALSFHPAGGQLAAATGKIVGIWDLDSGFSCASLRGHTNFLLSAVYHPNGQSLASGGFEGDVKLWDLGTRSREVLLCGLAFPFSPFSALTEAWVKAIGIPPHNLKGHVGRVLSIAFSPNGRFLLSAGVDGVFHVWDTVTWKQATPANGHGGHVQALAFRPDGSQFASAGSDATIRVWDAANFRPAFALRGHTDTIGGIAYSPDGQLIASVSLDRTVRIWDAKPPAGSPALTSVDPGK